MQGKIRILALAGLLALSAAAGASAAPLQAGVLRSASSLPADLVTVGDQASLGELALRARESEPASNPRGLAAVALDAVTPLSGLRQGSSRMQLSGEFTLVREVPSLYTRVVDLADQYQVAAAPRRPAEETALTGHATLVAPGRGTSWPSLAVPEVSLPASGGSAALAELLGVQLSGRLAPPADDPLLARTDAAPAYDLVASVPLVPSKVDVSAHYRLVDVDRLEGAAESSPPQTVGVGGQIALSGGTLLKAGYEVTRDQGQLTGRRADAGLSLKLDPRTDLSAGLSLDRQAEAGDQVRTSVDVGYRLSDDAALRASYTLINFASTAPAAAGAGQGHRAAAELSLRF